MKTKKVWKSESLILNDNRQTFKMNILKNFIAFITKIKNVEIVLQVGKPFKTPILVDGKSRNIEGFDNFY